MPAGLLRDMSKMRTVNDGMRTLSESIMVPAVGLSLRAWVEGQGGGVLIGDATLGYHARPRHTEDIYVLFLREDAVPASVVGFERIGASVVRHRRTRIEVRVVTPELARTPFATAERVVATAAVSDGMPVASPSGLVALKLLGPPNMQARAGMVALIKTGRVELDGFYLPEDKLATHSELVIAAKRDLHPA